MPQKGAGVGSGFFLAVIAAIVIAGGWFVAKRFWPAPLPTRTATTLPATTQASSATPAARPPRSFMDLLAAAYPSYPTTQPLNRPVNLRYAGHFLLEDTVYLDRAGNLWITRADAEETPTLLARPQLPQVILTRERPLFVHWASAEDGSYFPHLIVRTAGGLECIDVDGHRALGSRTDYDWPRAVSWFDKLIVPTSSGVSIFAFGPQIREIASPELADADAAHSAVQIQFDWRGLIAWIPPGEGRPGSTGAARFVEDKWVSLPPEAGWPAGIIHVVPLLDGSIMQIVDAGDERVKLNVVIVDPADIQEELVHNLINQLSDNDASARDRAYRELARYGPGIWPILEKRMTGEIAEVRSRLRDLLKAKSRPTLGHMQLIDNRMQLIARHPDGGVLFYSRTGVSIPRGDQQPELVPQAWISIRPGHAIRLLDGELVKSLDPDTVRIIPWYEDWIVLDEARGPLRYWGNTLVPILRKSELGYRRFVGIDRAGRYLFKQSEERTFAATLPAAGGEVAATLVIDPALPDPTPRLPAWVIAVNGETGWDRNDWPAMKQGGAWALGEKDWKALEKDEPLYTRADEIPPVRYELPRTPASTAPTTSTSQPASRPSDLASQKPLLIDTEGNAWFGGIEDLTIVSRSGQITHWPLPPVAIGGDNPQLVRAGNGRLFLFNRPGRILRIGPDPTGAEPFRIEATFTHNIPNQLPRRMWLDPFGRIALVHDTATLTILFPDGYIPTAIANLMPASAEEESTEE